VCRRGIRYVEKMNARKHQIKKAMKKTIQLHRKFCHSKITELLAIPIIEKRDSLPTGRHSFLYTDVTHSAAILTVDSTGSLLTVTRILWLTYYIEIVHRFHAMLVH